METEFNEGNVSIRVDGDVLDVMVPSKTISVPLGRLQVRLHRTGGKYMLAVGQSWYVDKDGQPLPPGPLYSFCDMAEIGRVGGTKVTIDPDREPLYRKFFTGLTPLCEDREVHEPPAEKEKRGLFGRRGK